MKKIIFIQLIVITAAVLFIYNGCASTTSTVRYGQKTEKTNDDDSSVRFSSVKDTTSNNEDLTEATKDTVDEYDDSTDPDDLPAAEKKIDISSLLKKYNSKDATKNLTATQINSREKILMEIIKYLDTPYKYGGNTKNGIDCSAFTKAVYSKALAVDLERSAREQFHEGEAIEDRSELQFGDLIFFNTRRRVKPGHVGIYIGDDLFAHASSRNGVIVSSLDEEYYSRRYMGARRIEDLSGSGRISGRNRF